MQSGKLGSDEEKRLLPPVEFSRAGTKILTRNMDEEESATPRVLFSGEPRRMTLTEFKEWMSPLPMDDDVVTLVLGIDKVVTQMKEVVTPYDTLDYYACRTLASLCPSSQNHLLVRAEKALSWAGKRQIILTDLCSAEYFTNLEHEINHINMEQTSHTEKVQRATSLLDKHETIARTISREIMSEDRCRETIYNLFDKHSALILQQKASNLKDFASFVFEAYKMASFLDQREKSGVNRKSNLLSVVPETTADSNTNEVLLQEIHDLKAMIIQIDERSKRPREEEKEQFQNKLQMILPHRMVRPLVCDHCGRNGHIMRDCRLRNNNYNQSSGSYNQSWNTNKRPVQIRRQNNDYGEMNNRRCYNCGDKGHASNNCNFPRPVCFRCKSAEHLILRCPHSDARVFGERNENMSRNDANESKTCAVDAKGATSICKYCGKVGHTIRECPQLEAATACIYCDSTSHTVQQCSEFDDFRKRNPEGARALAKKLDF